MQVLINGQLIKAKKGEVISSFLHIDYPCGGKAKCGKCKVIAKGELSPITQREEGFLSKHEIANGIRLACMTAIIGDAEIYTVEANEARILTEGKAIKYNVNHSFKKYGIAVDIGTTTVVVGLYSATGELLGKKGELNPQSVYGADVVSRIEASLSGKKRELQKLIVDLIEKNTSSLCDKNGISTLDIDGAVLTGNTAMLYLLTQESVETLARMPFSLSTQFGKSISAKDLGFSVLAPNTQIYIPPCISPFIGADTVCAMITTGFWDRNDTFVMIDIGTNGETVLFKNGKMYACSTAAGPAFEGVGLSCGMRGEDGAIDHVYFSDGELRLQTINNKSPRGICGSGIIDAIACLLESGVLDENGYMDEDVEIADNIYITKKDIRAVQLAKGAIYAGFTTLLQNMNINELEIDTFMIAGGFGGYINLENAGKVRLFPSEWVSRAQVLGNAAYSGAEALLLDEEMRHKCYDIIENVKVVELSQSPAFIENYTDGMIF